MNTEHTNENENEEEKSYPRSEKELMQLLKQAREVVVLLESHLAQSRKELQLTVEHIRKFYDFNLKHRTAVPDNVDESEYDHFNGLQQLTNDDIVAVLGEEHLLCTSERSLEDNIEDILLTVNQYYSWMASVNELNDLHDSYIDLMDTIEDEKIKKLQLSAEEEEDPEIREVKLKHIESYYNNKYLDFLAEPIAEKDMDVVLSLFQEKDEFRVDYLIKKCERKLNQLNIPTKFILEISQFEKRFLDEIYHINSNMFLLYFATLLRNADVYDKSDINRIHVICIVFTIDRFIRNIWDSETRERILNNIILFENQFMNTMATA